jgi:Na+-transporting methylmalonyl-CoA/oxaloacetate decarboxylase gamma subunit
MMNVAAVLVVLAILIIVLILLGLVAAYFIIKKIKEKRASKEDTYGHKVVA